MSEYSVMEFYLPDRVLLLSEHFESKLIHAQALWRGAVTRKRLYEVRQRYEELFETLEDHPLQHIVWHPTHHLCMPQWKYGVQTISAASVTNINKTSDGLQTGVTSCGSHLTDKSDESTVSRNVVTCETDHVKPNGSIKTVMLDEIPCHDTSVEISSRDCLHQSTAIECLPEKQGDFLIDTNHQSVTEHNVSTMNSLLPSATDCQISKITSLTTSEQVEKPLSSLDRQRLEGERSHIALELLWIQQAIDSRKQYLHLKTGMVNS